MPSAIPANPETFLRRRQVAAALTEAGYPMSFATLETRACLGRDGPPFRKWGSIPLYKWGEVLAWAEGRLSPVMHSTSEGDRRPAA
jgi:hypothetical protein